MLRKLKNLFYFPVAHYFRFFAKIRLLLWKPKIIVVTGSSGKTTLLHLLEAQLGNHARYSHHANSAYGIPFDILGLMRKDLTISEWPSLILSAPLKIFNTPYKEKLYIVEADCDRPGEGSFLGTLLKPDVTIWLSVGRTHSMNFDTSVQSKSFTSTYDAIAHEFGYFLEHTSSLVVVNGDSRFITKQLVRTEASAELITKNKLEKYSVSRNYTEFRIHGSLYKIPAVLPEETFYSIEAANVLVKYLKMNINPSFSNLYLPPGRSSVFKGIKNTTIIDSSYNTSFDGMVSMMKLLKVYPGDKKWAVVGDILEQGKEEQEEHEKLAATIALAKPNKVILIGPRVSQYTYPKLKLLMGKDRIEKFTTPKEALLYLENTIEGGETILFKGARFLEGIIEHLLEDKNDMKKLCRREKIWHIRREQWGL